MRMLLSLGSNLGDRLANLRDALDALGETTTVCAVSHAYETEPWGETEQPGFLNAAVEIETDFAPLELLEVVKGIEARLGRTPTYRWGPRMIDIDLILCEDLVLDSERLTVPHPEFRNRAFVLAPLAEIAPDAVDPATGETVAALASRADGLGKVEKHSNLKTP